MKRGDGMGARVLAKQLVSLRAQKTRNMATKSTVMSAGYSAQSIASQTKVATALASTTQVMRVSNQQMNISQIQKTVSAYEQESSKMEMKTELSIAEIVSSILVDETMDSVFEGDEDAESEMISMIYDEIGLDYYSVAAKTPTRKLQADEQEEEHKGLLKG